MLTLNICPRIADNLARIAALAALAIVSFSAYALVPDWDVRVVTATHDVLRTHAADFNGDGRPDLAATYSNQRIAIALTANDGTIGAFTIVHTGTTISQHVVGDFDEDGDADIVVADTATNALVMLPGNGDGTFGTAISTAIPTKPDELDLGEFTTDGHLDIVVHTYDDPRIAIYAGNGDGGFAEASRRTIAMTAIEAVVGDLDGDGKRDVIVSHADPESHELHYGRGDGTFDPAVTIAAADDASSGIVIADFDEDGRNDIATAEFTASTFTIIRNLGARAFAAPVTQTITASLGPASTFDLIAGEFTGDDHLDLVVAMRSRARVATLAGNGDGTFDAAVLKLLPYNAPYGGSMRPQFFTPADFNGDGDVDLAVAAHSGLVLFKPRPGHVNVSVVGRSQTITAGQPATFEISVAHADADDPWYGTLPAATGTVTLKNGDTILGSTTVPNPLPALLEVTLPAAGMQTLTVEYSGDANYVATVSADYTQKVVNEATTTTLTSPSPAVLQYGQYIHLQATVSSPLAGPIDGNHHVVMNGVRQSYAFTGSPANHYLEGAPAGTHSIQVRYEGNATHPGSTSNAIVRTITKAPTLISTQFEIPVFVRHQNQTGFYASFRGNHLTHPNGTMRITEGPVTVSTGEVWQGGGYAKLDLPVGVHYLRIHFDGDANHLPARTGIIQYTVIANGAFFVNAVARNSSVSAQGYSTGPAPAKWRVHSRMNDGAWTTVAPQYAQYSIASPVAGAVYTFRMEALDANDQVIATSNTDTAMLATFTNDPLAPGTIVKAQHVEELLTAVNTMRSRAGLPAVTLTNFGAGQAIRADHLLALRNGIDAARVAFGATAATWIGGLAAGAPVQAAHVQDLRDVIR